MKLLKTQLSARILLGGFLEISWIINETWLIINENLLTLLTKSV